MAKSTPEIGRSVIYYQCIRKAIKENPIDKDYYVDFYENASSTKEQISVQKKYAEIWKEEMNRTIDCFSEMLSDEERASFIHTQELWENSTNEILTFENAILTSEQHQITLGSSYAFSRISEHREAYRQRTIRIKYLYYLLERRTYQKNQKYQSLTFSYED